jgi:protocatechuate 3,4-dioxygenase beta subunit
VPLALAFRVSQVGATGCTPLPGAVVDVWHCDAAGVYSGTDASASRPIGARFLRGYQPTDAEGRVRFTTIYPGAYPGRAVHIHFKVRTRTEGRGKEFTSQLYFDDALTDRVHAQMPYAGPGERRTRNARDGLFRSGGDALTLAVVPAADGFAATYAIGVASG